MVKFSFGEIVYTSSLTENLIIIVVLDVVVVVVVVVVVGAGGINMIIIVIVSQGWKMALKKPRFFRFKNLET